MMTEGLPDRLHRPYGFLRLCVKCRHVVGCLDENGLCDYNDGCSVKYCGKCLRFKEMCKC
jgi:hypothetical protein